MIDPARTVPPRRRPPHVRRQVCLLAAGAIVVLAGLSSRGVANSSAAGPAKAACSRSTAQRLINKHHWNPFFLPHPVGQVLCGPFTGRHSHAMALGALAATCWPIQRWAVLTRHQGHWRLVLNKHEWVYPLERTRGGLRATSPVHAPSDSGRCVFTGGTRSRVWRWQGGKLAHGPWHNNPPRFISPDHQVSCTLSQRDYATGRPPEAVCSTADALHQGTVRENGHTTLCNDPTAGCTQSFSDNAAVLDYGETDELYGFRCQSATTGITCVAESNGKGFLIDKDQVERVG